MKITILVDNTTLTDVYYRAEPAFAAWIEDGNTKILFDCGYSDIILSNADEMGIDILTADAIVFSHGHPDHTWGLVPILRRISSRAALGKTIPKMRFIGHPASFWSRTSQGVPETGPFIHPEGLSRFGDVIGTRQPRYLTETLIFMGEIPSLFSFDQRTVAGTLFTPDGPVGDDIPDDSAIVGITGEGLVIITGCAHAGICSVIERAMSLTGDRRIRDIIGGFHLYQSPQHILASIAGYLQEIRPQELHPCHCTGQHAAVSIAGQLSLKETGVGTVLEYL